MLLFNHASQPITILVAVPLAACGALLITGLDVLLLVLIGGMITSTVLSLIVVPTAFTLVEHVEEWVVGKFGRKAATT